MSKQTNIPTLRFPEFNGEWEKKKLGEIGVNIIDGDRGVNYPNGNDFSESGFCLFLNAKNVTKNGFSFISSSFITKEKDEKLRKGKLKDLDVVLTTRGSVGHVAFFNNTVPYKHLRINSGMVLIRTNSNFVTPEYLYKYFNSNQIQNEIRKISFGSAQPQLTVGEIEKFKLAIPQLTEQQKIATFLTAVDSKIELLQKKKQGLEQYKKGVMQQIFSQMLRFKDESGNNYPDWEEKKLGDLCVIKTGKLDANAMVENGDYRFYTCAKDYYRIDNYAFDTEALLVSGNGANVGYIHYYKGKFNAYQRTYVLDGFEQNIQYIKCYLDKNLYERISNEKKDGNTPYIVLSTLKDMQIKLPCSEEQTQIANFLSAIDNKIALVNTQLENTQQFKKGLLQQMFV